jgi:Bifunctional DNA primase/polymerase, N-terminal
MIERVVFGDATSISHIALVRCLPVLSHRERTGTVPRVHETTHRRLSLPSSRFSMYQQPSLRQAWEGTSRSTIPARRSAHRSATQRSSLRASLRTGIDVRGDGRYTVAPGSMHPSERSYHWLHQSRQVAPARISERLLTTLMAQHRPAGSQIRGGEKCHGQFAGILWTYAYVALRDEIALAMRSDVGTTTTAQLS